MAGMTKVVARSVIVLLLSVLALGCDQTDELKRDFDYFSFELTGGTFFSQPSLVTTKELHFDTGQLIGREVILEGKVLSLGKFDTYLVIGDDVGRMLVVLTHIEEASQTLGSKKPKRLKVLGTVERGKKGLPYILAKSLKPIKVDT
jgi:hypothetical protein